LEPVHTLGIPPGIYRVQELAERLSVSRTTIDRYIKRFSIEITDVIYQNKPVKALIIDERIAAEMQALSGEAVKQVHPSIQTPVEPEEGTRSDLFERDNLILNERLDASLTRISDLERLLASKESEISTLKTALTIVERHNQESVPALEFQRKPTGLIDKIKTLFS